eukprot:Skav225706  [mRNA]  locus=scaffold5087:57147:57569:+ [translate_table: standard]
MTMTITGHQTAWTLALSVSSGLHWPSWAHVVRYLLELPVSIGLPDFTIEFLYQCHISTTRQLSMVSKMFRELLDLTMAMGHQVGWSSTWSAEQVNPQGFSSKHQLVTPTLDAGVDDHGVDVAETRHAETRHPETRFEISI